MSPAKVWVPLEVPTATAMNRYLQEQTVPTFQAAGERSAQNPTPPAGQLCYLANENRLYRFDGTQWLRLGTGLVAVAAGSSAIQQGQAAVNQTVPWSAFAPSSPAWEQLPNVVAGVGPVGGPNLRVNVNVQNVTLDGGVAYRVFTNDSQTVNSTTQVAVWLIAVGPIQGVNP